MGSDIRRISRLLLGLMLYAFGIALTINAGLGLAPWDVFHQGVSLQLGITFGRASIIVSLAVVAAVLLIKESIGIGTLFNVVFIGLFVDVLLAWGRIPKANDFFSGVLLIITGLFTIAFAMYYYISAGYGAGPRDSLMVILTKWTRRPVGFCRAIVEGAALICGWILGGQVGIGTVITVFCTGFAIQVVFSLVHFDVRAVRHESFSQTCRRLGLMRR